jgi:hypothetical protein
MNAARRLCLLALAVAATGAALAQTPDLSGFWAPEPNARVVADARLVDAISGAVLAEQKAHDAHVVRWCNPLGMPAMMEDALDIRQTERYLIVASEAHSFVRYVYFDLPPRDPNRVDLTSVGHSDGRWEGDTLVVSSYAFAGFDYSLAREEQQVKGLIAIPGGGFRTPASRLVERFRLTNDGDVLVVESTWTDPTVFASPHTYTRRYLRREPHYEPPLRLYCDPFDRARAEFLGDG